jgi:Flp pilus assembly protein TadD
MARAALTRFSAASVLLASAIMLAGCQNKTAGLDTDPLTTATAGDTAASPDPSKASFKQTEALSKEWQKDKSNVKVGLAYADSLGALGQVDQQTAVLQALAQNNPNDGTILSAAGKALLKANRPAEAIGLLDRAATLPGADWQTLSALGSAYDQQGRHSVAREKYQAALNLKPGEISVQNNIGMSYSLEGKLPEAEKMLRAALESPGGKDIPRVRQNLALVVGLQGRFDEARKIASEDLPPDQVEANLEFLQKMLAQPNTWAQLSDDQG